MKNEQYVRELRLACEPNNTPFCRSMVTMIDELLAIHALVKDCGKPNDSLTKQVEAALEEHYDLGHDDGYGAGCYACEEEEQP